MSKMDRAGFIGTTAAALAAGGAPADAQTAPERPGTDPTLPKDVYASSRSRVPLIRRDQLASDEDLAAYDAIGTTSLAGLQGPAGINLYSLKATKLSTALNRYLRSGSVLDARLSELVMLVSAREMDSAFEWSAHEPAARKAGLEPNIIDVVRRRSPTAGLPEKEAAIIALGRESLGRHNVSPETFATAQRLFGNETLVNICLFLGNYAMTATLLHVFGQELPAGVTSTLPIPAR
jgi:4-carboxymuconolactone decarboxylase